MIKLLSYSIAWSLSEPEKYLYYQHVSHDQCGIVIIADGSLGSTACVATNKNALHSRCGSCRQCKQWTISYRQCIESSRALSAGHGRGFKWALFTTMLYSNLVCGVRLEVLGLAGQLSVALVRAPRVLTIHLLSIENMRRQHQVYSLSSLNQLRNRGLKQLQRSSSGQVLLVCLGESGLPSSFTANSTLVPSTMAAVISRVSMAEVHVAADLSSQHTLTEQYYRPDFQLFSEAVLSSGEQVWLWPFCLLLVFVPYTDSSVQLPVFALLPICRVGQNWFLISLFSTHALGAVVSDTRPCLLLLIMC